MKIKILLAFVVLCGGLVGLTDMVAAADDESVQSNTVGEGSEVSVAPSYQNLGTIKSGETYDKVLKIRNNTTDQVKNFKISLNTFWAKNDEYELQWGVSESQYGRIVDWTNIDTEKLYQVEPGETYELHYTITVPEGQPGGAQRLMITIELGSANKEGTGFVDMTTALNTLTYATVDGEINPQAKIVSQDIQTFSFDNKIKTSSTLENTGNVDLDVKYHLQITNPFTGEIDYEVNDTKTLMAETTRIYEQVWQNAPFIGVFNVKQEIELMGETKVLEKITFICPLWLVIIVAIIIALIIISVIIKHKERKKNRRIEEKMERAGFNG